MDRAKFEQQTSDILCCFFEESYLDVDGPSDFDAEKIAAQLRQLGDHYDETVIQPLMRDVQKALPDQAAVVFSNSVDVLCNLWVSERPEVVPEKHLLKATMALSLYMMRNCPNMKTHVRAPYKTLLTIGWAIGSCSRAGSRPLASEKEKNLVTLLCGSQGFCL